MTGLDRHSSSDPVLGPVGDVADALRLDALPQAVRTSRAWVAQRAVASGAGEDAVHVAELLTTELVTNALKFGPVDGHITVRVHRHDGVLDVAVTDDSHLAPVLRSPDLAAEGGRGLLLVAELADRWGVALHAGGGKSVWFDLRLTAA